MGRPGSPRAVVPPQAEQTSRAASSAKPVRLTRPVRPAESAGGTMATGWGQAGADGALARLTSHAAAGTPQRPRPSARPPSPATLRRPTGPVVPSAPPAPQSLLDPLGPSHIDSPGAQVTFAPGASVAFLGAPRLRPPSPNSHKRLGSSTDLRFGDVFPKYCGNVPEYQFTHAGGTPGACVTGEAGAVVCSADSGGDGDAGAGLGLGGAPATGSRERMRAAGALMRSARLKCHTRRGRPGTSGAGTLFVQMLHKSRPSFPSLRRFTRAGGASGVCVTGGAVGSGGDGGTRVSPSLGGDLGHQL